MKDVGQGSSALSPQVAIAALRQAVPYVRLFRGHTFVVKAGGAALQDPELVRGLVDQVAILHQLGIRVVLVHGGGPQASALLRALGGEPRFVEGRRVTDETALAAAVLALNGEVNTRILAACRAAGLPAVGVSGVDAGLVRAVRRAPVARADGSSLDYGLVGDVIEVRPQVLVELLDAGYVPIVSPLAADDAGAILNLNADGVAARVAVALAAAKLVVLTDAPGLLADPRDPRSLVSYTDLAGLAALRARGALRDGMAPKAQAVEAALAGGVARAHLLPSRVADSLLLEVFTNEGAGTLVVPDVAALTPAEQAAGHAGDEPAAELAAPPAAPPGGPEAPAA
jgi:acetylglutamate kinase